MPFARRKKRRRTREKGKGRRLCSVPSHLGLRLLRAFCICQNRVRRRKEKEEEKERGKESERINGSSHSMMNFLRPSDALGFMNYVLGLGGVPREERRKDRQWSTVRSFWKGILPSLIARCPEKKKEERDGSPACLFHLGGIPRWLSRGDEDDLPYPPAGDVDQEDEGGEKRKNARGDTVIRSRAALLGPAFPFR